MNTAYLHKNEEKVIICENSAEIYNNKKTLIIAETHGCTFYDSHARKITEKIKNKTINTVLNN